jgi:tRNA nucleotidyltransferase/poly(A) polymerase
LRACARLKSGVATLSAERVWAELKRLLSAPDPTRALLWMRTTEVLGKALPESWGIDAIHRLVRAEQAQSFAPDALLRLEAILPPHRARIDALSERLRLSRAETARLLAWADAPEIDPAVSDDDLAKPLYRGEPQGILDRMKHALARELDAGNAAASDGLRRLVRFAAGWRKPTFPIGGKDLVAAGVEPGPEVGRRLKALEEEWVESGFSLDREALLRAAASA